MKFGETVLEFSKETFFHNVLDGFFFCAAFTRGVFTNVPVKQHTRIIAFAHLPWPVLKSDFICTRFSWVGQIPELVL
jgi:hypothetical protein